MTNVARFPERDHVLINRVRDAIESCKARPHLLGELKHILAGELEYIKAEALAGSKLGAEEIVELTRIEV